MSRSTTVVIDGSKIGTVTLGYVAPIESFDYLITDQSAPKAELEEIGARGVKIRIAEA